MTDTRPGCETLAAGFLVRLLMIQHDCGHGSFFPGRTTNDRIGRIIGVLTLTPYGEWRRSHAVHHATRGDLDPRGMGDVPLLTVAEYRGRSRWRRIAHRLSRNPLVVLAGVWLFYVQQLPQPVAGDLAQSLGCFRPALWDEESRRLVGSRDLREPPAEGEGT